MKIIYFDCFSGISGDMTLGALIDAGLKFSDLKSELSKLKISGYKLSVSKVKRAGITATKFNVEITQKSKSHRGINDIIKIINKSLLSSNVKELSKNIFLKLAQAEAKVHNKKISDVHFHEVGAIDSIIDIVGTAIAIEKLKIDEIYSSSVNLGYGTIKCEHGILPVPAPATAHLMQGIPAYSSKISDIDNIELTTPTGAVILKTLGNGFGKMPLMQIENIGYGAGNNDFKNYPNVLRVFISKATKDYVTDTINIIEANIDDLNPLVYGYLMEQLFSKGALDVTLTPTIMKKNRPGIILSVLTEKYYMSEIIDLIFAETTTFGVRTYEVERYKLEREIKEIKTKFGKIKFKIGKLKNKILTISPEYEDCKKIAIKNKIPLKNILNI